MAKPFRKALKRLQERQKFYDTLPKLSNYSSLAGKHNAEKRPGSLKK